MTTMLWEYVGHLSLMVLVHGETAPSDAEWDTYMNRLSDTYPEGRLRGILVFSDGPGPNARQRQQLHHHSAHPVTTAVVTHSVGVRGIVTALNWFYEIRAFAPAQLDAAFEYLGISRFDRITVRKTVAALRANLSDTSAPVRPFELAPRR